MFYSVREGTFLIGGGGGLGYLKPGPPTSQIGLMHDPSQISQQKDLTLPQGKKSRT